MSLFAKKPASSSSGLFTSSKQSNPFKSAAPTSSSSTSLFADSSKERKNPFAKSSTGSSLFPSSSSTTRSPFQSSTSMGGGGGGSSLFHSKTQTSSGSPFKSGSPFVSSKPSGGSLFASTSGAKDSLFKSSLSSGRSSTFSFAQGASPYAAAKPQEPAGPQMVQSSLTPAMIVDMIKSRDYEPDNMLKGLNPMLAELPEQTYARFKAYFDTTYNNFDQLHKIAEQAKTLDKELDDTIERTKEQGAELLSHLQTHDKMESKLSKSQKDLKKLESFSSQTHLIVKGLTQLEQIPSQDFTDLWNEIFKDYRQNLRQSETTLKNIERMSAANDLLENDCELMKHELATTIESISLEQRALLELNLYFKAKISGLGPMKNWVLQKEGKIPTQKKVLKGREFLIDLAEQVVTKKREKEERVAQPEFNELPDLIKKVIELQRKEKVVSKENKEEQDRLQNFQRLVQHLSQMKK